MKNLNFIYLCLFVVLLPFVCTIDKPSFNDANAPDQKPLYHIIILENGNLVLDASDFVVHARNFTLNNPYQLWTLEPTPSGGVYIINLGNNKVLDVKDGIIAHKPIITWSNHGGRNQIWNIDGAGPIVSGVYNEEHLVIEINDNGEAVAEPRNEERHQKFTILQVNGTKLHFGKELAATEKSAPEEEPVDDVEPAPEKEPVHKVEPTPGIEPPNEEEPTSEKEPVYTAESEQPFEEEPKDAPEDKGEPGPSFYVHSPYL